jgi:hypothetical protein
MLREYRDRPTTLLILGGTARDRERVAHRFLDQGPLHAAPFVRVDCARQDALLRGALERWLTSRRAGPVTSRLDAAERGTLFVDHIGAARVRTQRLLLAFVLRHLGPGPVDEASCWGGCLMAGAPDDPAIDTRGGRFSSRLLDVLDKMRVDLRPRGHRGARGAPRRRTKGS